MENYMKPSDKEETLLYIKTMTNLSQSSNELEKYYKSSLPRNLSIISGS